MKTPLNPILVSSSGFGGVGLPSFGIAPMLSAPSRSLDPRCDPNGAPIPEAPQGGPYLSPYAFLTCGNRPSPQFGGGGGGGGGYPPPVGSYKSTTYLIEDPTPAPTVDLVTKLRFCVTGSDWRGNCCPYGTQLNELGQLQCKDPPPADGYIQTTVLVQQPFADPPQPTLTAKLQGDPCATGRDWRGNCCPNGTFINELGQAQCRDLPGERFADPPPPKLIAKLPPYVDPCTTGRDWRGNCCPDGTFTNELNQQQCRDKPSIQPAYTSTTTMQNRPFAAPVLLASDPPTNYNTSIGSVNQGATGGDGIGTFRTADPVPAYVAPSTAQPVTQQLSLAQKLKQSAAMMFMPAGALSLAQRLRQASVPVPSIKCQPGKMLVQFLDDGSIGCIEPPRSPWHRPFTILNASGVIGTPQVASIGTPPQIAADGVQYGRPVASQAAKLVSKLGSVWGNR